MQYIPIAKDEVFKPVVLDGEEYEYNVSNYGRLYSMRSDRMLAPKVK